jgi:hypothetical protein
MGLKKDISALVEASYAAGRDGEKIAQRLIEAGLRMMADEGRLYASHRLVPNFSDDGEDSYFEDGFHLSTFTHLGAEGLVNIGNKNVAIARVPEMAAAIRFAGELFDGYARHHLSKPDPEKAKRNVEAAVKMFAALDDDYTPPEVPINLDFSPVESDSGAKAAGTARKLLSDLHIAEIGGEPSLGVRLHLDDQPILQTLVEIGFLNRDDVSDKVTLTTKGKDALGVRPDGVPHLPVEVAEVTGNVEERELAGQYIDAKIRGVEKWIVEHPGDADKHNYEIMARILIEVANEFRIGLHIPPQVIEGRVIPYNEDRSTGITHAEGLRTFFKDVYARNVKAGWWTEITTGEPKKRNVGELFMLMVTELVEAYDGYVSGAADEKLPEHPELGVEMGDLLIRIADFCGALLEGNIVECSDAANPGDQMFQEVCEIARHYESIRKTPAAIGDPETGEPLLPQDVAVMTDAKLAFNAHRADHKIENRLKDDGKKT